MDSKQDNNQTREDSGTGFPIEGKIAISVIILGVIALVLKALGVI